jgi:hypothetical protein
MNDSLKAQEHNSVSLHPAGYVQVRLVGKQDYMSVDAVAAECKKFAQQLTGEGRPIIGLVDASEDLGFNTGTNKAVLRALEEITYDRVAIFGTHKILAEVTKAVIAALGKDDRTKIFDTREEALAWLLMKDPLKG